jgi:hypothetical protein
MAKRQQHKSKESTNTMTLRDLFGPLTMPAELDNYKLNWVKANKDGSTTLNFINTKKADVQPAEEQKEHKKFIVRCTKLSAYTTIGADNMHHASNKATKNFGPHWSSISPETHHELFTLAKGTYQFYPAGQFADLLRTLQN